MTNPAAGPGVIFHPEHTGFGVCGIEYDVQYEDLTDTEKAAHREWVRNAELKAIGEEVERRLPMLPSVAKPVRRIPSFDFLWLAGLTAYWVVGSAIGWGLLAAIPMDTYTALAIALSVSTIVYIGFVIQWWSHHAKLWADLKQQWANYERFPEDRAKREADRAALLERIRDENTSAA